MPWIGLDQQGCGYLKHNCTPPETGNALQQYSYPIHIMKEYPRVSSNVRWVVEFSLSNFDILRLKV